MIDADSSKMAGKANYREFLLWLARRNRLLVRPAPLGTVSAYLNWGRWVADCPFCRGAEVVGKQSKLFFCLSCGMIENGHHTMAVRFPEDIAEIEAALADEPVARQNWQATGNMGLAAAERQREAVE